MLNLPIAQMPRMTKRRYAMTIACYLAIPAVPPGLVFMV
jgi:hypothetical protein